MTKERCGWFDAEKGSTCLQPATHSLTCGGPYAQFKTYPACQKHADATECQMYDQEKGGDCLRPATSRYVGDESSEHGIALSLCQEHADLKRKTSPGARFVKLGAQGP